MDQGLPVSESLFTEEQKLARLQGWFWIPVVLAVGLVWYGFAQQVLLHRPFGNNPGPDWLMWLLVVLLGIGFPLLVVSTTMTTMVLTDAIRIRYFPFLQRTIPLRDITACIPCVYRPLRDYGGWGIRWSLGRGMVYSVAGNKAVRLDLARGRQLLIGSQDPEQLAAAIQAALRAARPRP